MTINKINYSSWRFIWFSSDLFLQICFFLWFRHLFFLACNLAIITKLWKLFFKNLKKTYLQSSLSYGKVKSSLGLRFFSSSFSAREYLHSVFLTVDAAIANFSRLNDFIAWLERVPRQDPVGPSCWVSSIRYWKIILLIGGECIVLARSLFYSLWGGACGVISLIQ